MAKRRTGTLRTTRDGRFRAIITLNCGKRLLMDPFPAGTTKTQAKRKAQEYAERAQRENWVVPEHNTLPQPFLPADQSMTDWVDRWLDDRRLRGLTSVRENESHWRLHIQPVMGEAHIESWTDESLRRLVESLDKKVRRQEMRWKTACNVWGTASKMCADACRSKINELRCRRDNPAKLVQGPDRLGRTEKQYLYPSEFLALMSCPEVPIRWRQIFAAAVYLYVRAGELRVLRWQDIDLQHQMVHIHRASDRTNKAAVKPVKSRYARRLSIEPALLPLLDQLECEAEPTDRAFEDMPSERAMAVGLRRHLKRAGVERMELFVGSPTRRQITFHDLRATGITWMAVRGDEPLRIQQRAGHRHFQTTMGYIRTAEELKEGFGQPFPELPDCVMPFVRQRQLQQDAEQAETTRQTLAAQRVVSLERWRSTS